MQLQQSVVCNSRNNPIYTCDFKCPVSINLIQFCLHLNTYVCTFITMITNVTASIFVFPWVDGLLRSWGRVICGFLQEEAALGDLSTCWAFFFKNMVKLCIFIWLRSDYNLIRLKHYFTSDNYSILLAASKILGLYALL